MFLPVNSPAPTPFPNHAPQHHLPDVRLSSSLRGLVLPQRGNLFHRQNSRLHSIQLRVSTNWTTSLSLTALLGSFFDTFHKLVR